MVSATDAMRPECVEEGPEDRAIPGNAAPWEFAQTQPEHSSGGRSWNETRRVSVDNVLASVAG